MIREKNRGFTLIELLVVIAIIGILAAIVLASLGTARDSARDASATASMSAMRAEAEIAYDGGYPSNLCDAGGALGDLISAIDENVPSPGVICDVATDGTGWSAVVALTSGQNFCVDSEGFAGNATTTPPAACDN